MAAMECDRCGEAPRRWIDGATRARLCDACADGVLARFALVERGPEPEPDYRRPTRLRNGPIGERPRAVRTFRIPTPGGRSDAS